MSRRAVAYRHRFATASAACSSVSSAIFCASIMSPTGRHPSGPKHHDLHIVLVEFVNVHLTTVADAIVLPAVAAGHIEAPRALVLRKLDRRQPLFQQVERFLLGLPAPGRRTGEIPPPCMGKPQYRDA